MTKSEFLSLVKDLGLDTRVFRRIATICYVELGMKPDDAQHELRVIEAMMDLEAKRYLSTQLADNSDLREDTFYLLNMTFWRQWLSYSGASKDTGNEESKK